MRRSRLPAIADGSGLVAGAAAIWLFISGFVPSVLSGQAFRVNALAVGVVFVATAVSAYWHLRDDIRHARPLTM